MNPNKPLGGKAYGHIAHLPNSRMGSGDHHCHIGQARICLEKVRDKHDFVIVTEKLDGSNCSVAMLQDGSIVALGRSGYLAQTSKFEQHQLFADWVRKNESRFNKVLAPNERVCGEWLAQAHGTRYNLWHEPFVIFDLFQGKERMLWKELGSRLRHDFILPYCVHANDSALSIENAMTTLNKQSGHGAMDAVEGAVWRVEREGKVDFIIKFVNHDKLDGCYLPEMSGKEAIWNWRP